MFARFCSQGLLSLQLCLPDYIQFLALGSWIPWTGHLTEPGKKESSVEEEFRVWSCVTGVEWRQVAEVPSARCEQTSRREKIGPGPKLGK